MSGPLLLDLFCGAGGAARGYHDAGFDIIGVDIERQPSYPYVLLRRDVMEPGMLAELVKCLRPSAIHASPPCFPAGTPVLTARGMIPIEEVAVGDRVLTHQNRWRRVTDTMNREAEVWRARWMAATPDHPFWARVGWTAIPGWAPASELRGLHLAVPAEVEPLPVPQLAVEMGVPFWYMVGRWLGDGWVRRVLPDDKHWRTHGKSFAEQQVCPGCDGPSAPNRRWPHLWNLYCSRRCSARVGRRSRTISRADVAICCANEEADGLQSKLGDTGLTWRRSQERTTTRFTASNVELCDWLTMYFGRHARSKTLPGWAFGMAVECRAALLDGYVAADGSTASNPAELSITTVSAQLVFATRVLATGLGWNTSLHRIVPSRARCFIEGREVRELPSWQLRLNRSNRYTREIGGHRWHRQRQPFTPHGVERVYDVTVDEDHSFVAWGFVVHNCQAYSMLNAYNGKDYPDLVERVRDMLVATGVHWVIENVPQAPLIDPVVLCGGMFGLRLKRHRGFESNLKLSAPHHPPHGRCARNGNLPNPDQPWMTITGGKHSKAWQLKACEYMGTPWMRTIRDVCEAIPPAYTKHVGAQLLEHIDTTIDMGWMSFPLSMQAALHAAFERSKS